MLSAFGPVEDSSYPAMPSEQLRIARNGARLRIAKLIILLPVLAQATTELNAIEVTPESAEQLGVKVQVWDLAGRDRVAITYPSRVDEVWVSEEAEIYIKKGQDTPFFAPTIVEPKAGSPISFQLDDKDGAYDATVIIHYSCMSSRDERCRGFTGLMYHITSIAAYAKIIPR